MIGYPDPDWAGLANRVLALAATDLVAPVGAVYQLGIVLNLGHCDRSHKKVTLVQHSPRWLLGCDVVGQAALAVLSMTPDPVHRVDETLIPMTRPAAEGEIRCASHDWEKYPDLSYGESPRCENVAEFHWTFRDGSDHQVFCEHHAAQHNRLGPLTRVTPDNPAVMTEWMVMMWGTPEESAAAGEAWRNRGLAEGRTVYQHGVRYDPDGTTSRIPPLADLAGEDSAE